MNVTDTGNNESHKNNDDKTVFNVDCWSIPDLTKEVSIEANLLSQIGASLLTPVSLKHIKPLQ